MTNWTEFVAASVAIILLPGPGQIAILTATLSGGRKAGLQAVAGLLTGDIVIMTLVAAGVATLFSRYPGVERAVRVGGALYILWIGLGVLRSPLGLAHAPADGAKRLPWYPRTVGITLLNPKAVLFFVSFFPQFVDRTIPLGQSFLRLGAVFTVLSGSYLVCFTWMGSRLGRLLRESAAAARWVPRVLGTIILAFGVRLLF
ncbi:MAG: LysE family transporter [Fibrobacteres bacterium]|nr:LysE family transporter [Fibrobacterota bacterium]